MKITRLLTILLCSAVTFCFTAEPCIAKTPVRKKAAAARKPSGLRQAVPQALYANFYGIPFDGYVPSLQDLYSDTKSTYSVVPGTKIKEMKIHQGGGMVFFEENLQFDSDGKLTSYSWFTNYNHPDVKIEFTYDDNGRLMSLKWTEDDSMGNAYDPLLTRNYEYVWGDDGKVIQIIETMKADNGINYVGKPMRMDLFYDDNDRLVKGVCNENSDVFVSFNSDASIVRQKFYYPRYSEGTNDSSLHKKRSKLEWELNPEWTSSYIPYFSDSFILNRHPESLDSDCIFKYDAKKNWVEAQSNDGYYSIERTLVY